MFQLLLFTGFPFGLGLILVVGLDTSADLKSNTEVVHLAIKGLCFCMLFFLISMVTS